jgi:hypothetical protein
MPESQDERGVATATAPATTARIAQGRLDPASSSSTTAPQFPDLQPRRQSRSDPNCIGMPETDRDPAGVKPDPNAGADADPGPETSSLRLFSHAASKSPKHSRYPFVPGNPSTNTCSASLHLCRAIEALGPGRYSRAEPVASWSKVRPERKRRYSAQFEMRPMRPMVWSDVAWIWVESGGLERSRRSERETLAGTGDGRCQSGGSNSPRNTTPQIRRRSPRSLSTRWGWQ